MIQIVLFSTRLDCGIDYQSVQFEEMGIKLVGIHVFIYY